eukprot:2504483-Rhodomonas_salina.3
MISANVNPVWGTACSRREATALALRHSPPMGVISRINSGAEAWFERCDLHERTSSVSSSSGIRGEQPGEQLEHCSVSTEQET